MLSRKIFFIVGWLISQFAFGQTGSIKGQISTENGRVEYASVYLKNTFLIANTNQKGNYTLNQIPFGTYQMVVSYVGFKPKEITVEVNEKTPQLLVNLKLTEKLMDLDAVVVTGTKTFKRKTSSPVIVNILGSQELSNVQACNLSEGLKFQPGLRVEVNCQTCNYTQLRMNGLAGGYSQILVNGRPIFSPLTGLYGMEQLPVNMIDRIEVVRGGGSSLYGSNAIGGTVNLITKIPQENSFETTYHYQNINSSTNDNQLRANSTYVSENKNAGVSFFLNKRERDFYDHNGDNFSEIPYLENISLGSNMFFLPTENQKLELSMSNLNEYRFGGEMELEKPTYLTEQSEERKHNVWMFNVDYQWDFNHQNSSLIGYLAWQNTDRKHYTGTLPESIKTRQIHLNNPPYGTSDVTTYNVGIQLNHRVKPFFGGVNIFTLGVEYLYDEVTDKIPAYRYLIDQTTKDWGAFLQSDWEMTPNLTFLMGVRMDKHNLVADLVLNPRVSLLYKWGQNTQFRLSYGTGFRAPQAFDADLHIAFAGGGISRISLAPDLTSEKSQSWSGSVNFDMPTENYIIGLTLEAFYTKLDDVFFQQPIEEDEFGQRFEKRNGQSATVQGLTLELRGNYNRKAQLETGFTFQSSEYENQVQYIDGLAGLKEFVRTPKVYGFASLSVYATENWTTNLNYVYTGRMKVPHFGGAPNQPKDEIIQTPDFHELNLKTAYSFQIPIFQTKLELFGGVKNILNDYQRTFDIGKNRDSDFIYGPPQPRTYFIGITFKS